jgi:Methyltransferase domain
MTPLEEIEKRLARLEERHRLLRDVVVRGFWEAMDRLDSTILPTRRMNCPICGRTEPRSGLTTLTDQCRFGGGKLERYLCPGCGCIYGPAKCLDISQDMVNADYALLYDSYAEADSTSNEIRAFRSLNPRPGGVYLDWGCGHWSNTIPMLRTEGYDVWGYEPSVPSEARDFIAPRRDGITGLFDGLFSNNVIEHMLQPVDEFRYFHSIMAAGTRMAHASPCYRYSYSDTRFHVVFLTGNSSRVLAERTGFRIVEREEEADFINVVFERV